MLWDGWITRTLHGAALALRGAASALTGLADLLGPDAAPRAPAAGERADGDGTAPRAGTRDRIGVVLERARSRYEAVQGAPRPRQ